MNGDPSQRVERIASVLAPELGAGAKAALCTWIRSVASWNERTDCTAARNEDELCDLMLADGFVLAVHVARGSSVVDVGSGAGAPAMALALCRPDLELTLVEPLQKRVAFLRTLVGLLLQQGALRPAGGPVALPRPPRILRSRADDVIASGTLFGAAISRATLPPPEWLKTGASLAPAGEVWVLLAQDAPPELVGWRVEDDIRYTWPLTGVPRRAVRYRSVVAAGR